MNNILIGIIIGTIAGIIDISPMIAMKLPWTANISALSMWIIIGFLNVTSSLKMNGIQKGILISFLILLPTAIIIGQNNFANLIPVVIMTFILGSLLGFLTQKFTSQQ